MMLSRLRRQRFSLAYASVFVMLSIRVGTGEGMVLCFEADGRVAVEGSVANGSCARICSPAQTHLHADPFNASLQPPIDCDCVDVPLMVGIDDTCKGAQRIEPTLSISSPINVLPSEPVLWDAFPSRNRHLPISPFPDICLGALSSVVLLI